MGGGLERHTPPPPSPHPLSLPPRQFKFDAKRCDMHTSEKKHKKQLSLYNVLLGEKIVAEQCLNWLNGNFSEQHEHISTRYMYIDSPA